MGRLCCYIGLDESELRQFWDQVTGGLALPLPLSDRTDSKKRQSIKLSNLELILYLERQGSGETGRGGFTISVIFLSCLLLRECIEIIFRRRLSLK